jgi:hypothetical protein
MSLHNIFGTYLALFWKEFESRSRVVDLQFRISLVRIQILHFILMLIRISGVIKPFFFLKIQVLFITLDPDSAT